MSLAGSHPVLLFVHLLAMSVWVGGFIAIVVVVRVARTRLGAAEQVAFFRALGRGYGIVAGLALLVGLSSGAALLSTRAWGAPEWLAAAIAAALVLSTVVGVLQAMRLTRLRQQALTQSDQGAAVLLKRLVRRATVLRSAIGALTLALLAVGVTLVR